MTDRVRYPLVLGLVCLGAALGLALTYAVTRGPIARKEQAKAEAAVTTAFFNLELPGGTLGNFYEAVPLPGEESKPKNLQEMLYTVYEDEARTRPLYAAPGTGQGYSSKVRLLVGVRPVKGGYQILGLKVIKQQETPGLGSLMDKTYTGQTLWTTLFGGGKKKPEPVPQSDHFKELLGGKTVKPKPRAPFQFQFAGKIVQVRAGRARGLKIIHGQWEKVKAGQKLAVPAGKMPVAAITGATISSKAVIAAVYDAILKIHRAVAKKGKTS